MLLSKKKDLEKKRNKELSNAFEKPSIWNKRKMLIKTDENYQELQKLNVQKKKSTLRSLNLRKSKLSKIIKENQERFILTKKKRKNF